MFYTILKKFFLKKKVVEILNKQQPLLGQQKIKTIGLLVDESCFSNLVVLVDAILSYGFQKEQIEVLVYKDKMNAKEVFEEPFLTLKNISLSGEIDKHQVQDFLEKPFDLLINYYDVNEYSLMLLSIKSKATFKAGFGAIDKRVNHLIIKEEIDNYKAFIAELFKYLKILNKI